MKQFAKIAAALLVALFMASAFIACSDGSEGGSGDRVVCTWTLSSDSTTFYVFYADKTVEGWSNRKLEYPRNTLSYTGNPIADGTVEIKTASGVTLFTFSVSGDVATASDYFGSKYYIKIPSTGDSGSSSGGGASGDKVVCTWELSSDPTNYYVFYADKTVEAYIDGKLEYPRNTLSYTGNPIADGGAGEIKTFTGVTLFTFRVSGSVATLYIVDSSFGTKYNVNSGSSNSGASGGTENKNPDTTEQSPTREDPITTDERDLNEDYYYDMDNVVCAWVQSDSPTNGYTFYRNHTVVQYFDNNFHALYYYDGNPEYGGATIRGVGIFIGESDRIDIGDDEWVWRYTIATDYNSGTQYRVITPDDDEWWEEEVTESGGSYSENPAW